LPGKAICVKLSETVLTWPLHRALQMHNPVFSPCRVFFSLDLEGIMLIYTSHWSALGIWLQTNSEFQVRWL